jgi:unsaturated chondroitin disaccharide hydrolase
MHASMTDAILPYKELSPSTGEEAWVEAVWQRTLAKLRRTSQRIGDSFPHVSKNGRYESAAPDWWTSGFWPGILWLAYQDTREDSFLLLAESCERQLDTTFIKDIDNLHHDVGFMWILSSLARFKLLRADDSRRRALLAANMLGGRFNLRGDFIRAWNQETPKPNRAGWAIIDCLMNLPLLFWASEICEDPRFKFIAIAHADTALEHFVRADGSTRHIVSFDPHTGDYIEDFGGQGYARGSAWSRGASWAIYGFALCYRYTREERYLEASLRVADFFTANLNEYFLPCWDFRAPPESRGLLDSSAGACAASGLLELARHTTGERSRSLRQAATKLVQALDKHCGAWDRDEEGLLLHATGHKAAESNVDVPIIYGDYFFVEALSKLRGQTQTFW